MGIIDKVEKYNGCILADSVGLGKTYTALAVIKYYELRNDRVLVLVPKRLRENWNNPSFKGRVTRYQRLMNDIIKSGVNSWPYACWYIKKT